MAALLPLLLVVAAGVLTVEGGDVPSSELSETHIRERLVGEGANAGAIDPKVLKIIESLVREEVSKSKLKCNEKGASRKSGAATRKIRKGWGLAPTKGGKCVPCKKGDAGCTRRQEFRFDIINDPVDFRAVIEAVSSAVQKLIDLIFPVADDPTIVPGTNCCASEMGIADMGKVCWGELPRYVTAKKLDWLKANNNAQLKKYTVEKCEVWQKQVLEVRKKKQQKKKKKKAAGEAKTPKSKKPGCAMKKQLSLGDADLDSEGWGRRRKKSSRGRKKKKGGFFERGKKMAAEKANKTAQAAKKARQMVAEKAGKAKRAAEKARKRVAEKAGKVKRAATERAKKVKQAAMAKAAKVAAMAKKAAEKAKKVKQAAVARAKKMKEAASKKVKKVKAMVKKKVKKVKSMVKNPLQMVQSLAKGGFGGTMVDKAVDMILKKILKKYPKAIPNISIVVKTALKRGVKAAIKETVDLYHRCPTAFAEGITYLYSKITVLKNKILVGMGINPCKVACVGRQWFTPVFDYNYPLVIRPAVANTKYGIHSAKLTAQAKRDMGDPGCNGWKPSNGKYKGQGGHCARFKWTKKWCYADKNYKGRGHEFIKPSEVYKGKFYMPCSGTGEFPTKGPKKALKVILAKCSQHTRTLKPVVMGGRHKTKKLYDCEAKDHICAMEFSWFTAHCHTCCCKGGLLKRYIRTELITDNAKDGRYHGGDLSKTKDCKKWFMLYDSVLRAFLSIPISAVLPSYLHKAKCKNY